MIVEALVKIDLKLDGSWRIVQIKRLDEGMSLDHLIPEPGTESAEQLDAAGPFTATEHLVNAHKVREHRRAEHSREYPAHGHCSICGRCGKKSSTHRGTYPGHYHTGEHIAAGKGC